MPLVLPRCATLPALLALLREHGPAALLGAEGLAPHAEALVTGHVTIAASERPLYGDRETWAAWQRLRDAHGAELRAMATAERARGLADNEARARASLIGGRASTGGDWFAEKG